MQFLTNVDGGLSADDLLRERSQFWHILTWGEKKKRHVNRSIENYKTGVWSDCAVKTLVDTAKYDKLKHVQLGQHHQT